MAKKQEWTGKETSLLQRACDAFGILLKYVFTHRVEGDRVSIVTTGGKRVHYRDGDQVEPLNLIEMTGVNPVKRKPITRTKKA